MSTKYDSETAVKCCSFNYCNKPAIGAYCDYHTCKTTKCYALAPNGYKYCIRHTCGAYGCKEQRDMAGLWLLIGTSPSQFMSYYCEEHEDINVRKWSYKSSENSP